MAATPEEVQGQGDMLTEPFSPSIFLDLPPSPRPDKKLAPSDDLVLPFISQMLMEEDMEDKFFFQYPDHPVLLQAQQTYANILSDAATTFAGSDSATTNTEGTSSNDAPTFANATWPYHPAELSQLLLSMPNLDTVLNGGDVAFQSSGFLDGNEKETNLTMPASFFTGQNMDKLNLAFLRGMEEAKKFLPTNNVDSKLFQGVANGQVEQDELVDGFQGSVCGRGRKNRRIWDDMEVEMGRNSKVMVPEPEETGDLVDEMIVDGYGMCLDKMKSLCITTGSEAEKKTRKQRNGKSVQGRSVDLRALLIHCAQAMSRDDRRSASELLRQIKQHSSPRGDSDQRLAHCFAEGLEARLAGTGSQVYKSLMTKRTSVVEFLKAYQLYLAACCFEMTAFRFSNMTICKAISGCLQETPAPQP